MVPKVGKVFGCNLNTERVVTQGDPVSTTIFNIVLYSGVRAVLIEVCGPHEAHHGFRNSAGEHKICFNADDGRIVGRNLIWVHPELTAIVTMFERVGLNTNIIKTKTMVLPPGFIWVQQGVEAYKQRDMV